MRANELECPSTTFGVFKRTALEVLFFRSLFTNESVDFREGPKVSYWSPKWIWLGMLVFHWSFLIILTRHLRFFTEPVPLFVHIIENIDGFFEITVPTLYITDVIILAVLTYLVLRRIFISRIQSMLFAADFFAFFLILSVVLSGVLMRIFFRVDLVSVKELAIGLLRFHPVVPEGIGLLFYIHLLCVCVLIAYFPFSKLMYRCLSQTHPKFNKH
jgi:nitrate reductase gamma subunit